MGIASTTKVITQNAGVLTEKALLKTSAGVGDAGAIPALNDNGVVDPTMLNAIAISAGVADANKMVQLGADGKLDTTVMPNGLGADTAGISASETLTAGDLVNVWNSGGTVKVRKAVNDPGKEAHGYVMSSYALNAVATVYFEGTCTGQSGLTGGPAYLSSTAGKATSTVPTGAGKILQKVGFATAATAVNFNAGDPIVMA